MNGRAREGWADGTPEEIGDAGESPRAASHGQILIMFALFLVGLLGILGLATDLGMAFAQRRTMQAAADAGALAGARAVARWRATAPISAGGEVAAMVAENRMDTTPTVTLCEYVNYAETTQGGCGATVPSGATGVHVRVEETHPTWFIRVIPGAPATIRIEAEAIAQVQRFQASAGDAPFIVCGLMTSLDGGGTYSIFSDAKTGAVNTKAYDRRFIIHDAQSNDNKPIVEDCDIETSSFKGLAKAKANTGKGEDDWWMGDTGTKAGPTSTTVNGIDGCQAGAAADDCVVFLPVATMDPPSEKVGNDRKFLVLRIMAFRVIKTAANQHVGIPLENYIVNGPGDETWCRDCDGAVVIKLTR